MPCFMPYILTQFRKNYVQSLGHLCTQLYTNRMTHQNDDDKIENFYIPSWSV